MPSYSGIWTLQAQMQAVAAGTWTGLPQLYSWGLNSSGQLGLGDTVNRSSPVQVAGDNWSKITGTNASIAIKTDGTMWSWGGNFNGSQGQNDTVTRSSPVQIGALNTWKTASSVNPISAAIKTDGTLWMWGTNGDGQLGQNNTINVSSPVQVGALTNWNEVSSGYACFAIKTDGTLWSWGKNTAGQLGVNNTANSSSPVQVGALTTWYQVSGSGDFFCLAIKTDGTLWAWGSNNNGQLGLGDIVNRSSPVQVGSLTTWANVSAGSNFNFCAAIKTDGTIWSWGDNTFGQLGQSDTVSRSSPVQVGALTNWEIVSATETNGCRAIKTDGTLWSWGANGSGQLGLGNTINRSSPVQIGSLTTWAAVKGGNFTLAIKTT